ncbi:hypothetical protein COI68_26070 [Priestia megaterium]|uniref:substrate-binding domain-containing protein n=1 Tax=Priestia megaterium TaxID=1404 RepID=UPI000BF74E13|nr:substrate-binding domain-containing protein [Priestia megaterium]PFI60718.1 hypothetical protein COI68_26070 [Priestia megaterium]
MTTVGYETKIRIGSPSEFFVQEALNDLFHIECRYELTFGITLDLLKQLSEHKIDCVIATKKYEIEGIEYIKIREEDFLIVAPTDVKEPEHPSNVKKWLEQQHWISYGPDLPIIRRIWRQHLSQWASITPFHIIPDLRGILRSVEKGMGISVLPTYLIKESVQKGNSRILFPKLAVKNQLYVAFRADSQNTATIQQIVNELRRENI